MRLDEAINLIDEHTVVLGCRSVPLKDAFGRVCSSNNQARLAVPGYDQSTRDGYAISGSGEPVGMSEYCFQIRGEIPAGLSHDLIMKPGEAYRIMTGGLVPGNADRVIAQEDCRVSATEVVIPARRLSAPGRFIRRRGSDFQAGTKLIEPGARLNESHLALLAASGNRTIEVYRRPRVAYFCSGSELVMAEDTLKNGQKFSSNHLLLDNLITRFGGRAEGCGVVADDPQAIRLLLDQITSSDSDIIISTGGVGPGKYDLFSELLPEVGARILYRTLQVRPGRSTLFGIIGTKLYFGLPGPPSAVRILFNELIAPVLQKMQGRSSFHNQRIDAFLDHDISLKSADALCFKDGCYRLEGGRVVVRYPKKYQMPNCSIMMLPGRNFYQQGDRVKISLTPPD